MDNSVRISNSDRNIHQKLQLDFLTSELLDEHIEKLDGKYKDKFCISQQVYDEIKTVLSLDKGEKCDSGSYFKLRRCQNFKFRTTEQSLIENIPGFEFLMDWSF